MRTNLTCLSLIASFSILTTAIAEEGSPAEREAVRVLHSDVITPASDALIAVETEIPGTDHAWEQVQGIAKELVKTGSRLQSFKTFKPEATWLKAAGALREESESAARAAASRNHEALVAANTRIVAACESCHNEFRVK